MLYDYGEQKKYEDDAWKQLLHALEVAILATKTGPKRELLTEFNIKLNEVHKTT